MDDDANAGNLQKSNLKIATLGIAAIFLMFSALKGFAQEVANANDAGPGSLRDVIASAANGTTITFAPGLSAQTIILTSGPIVVDKNLTIDADGKNVTIDGNSSSRIFEFRSGTTNSIIGLKLANGYATSGGAIWLGQAILVLSKLTFSENVAGYSGGAIHCAGATLTVNDSTFHSNSASQGGGAIGVDSNDNQILINNTLFLENTAYAGGAIGYAAALIIANNSTFIGNHAAELSVIFTQGSNSSQVYNNCTFTQNSGDYYWLGADGDIYITINNTILAGNILGNGISGPSIEIGHNLTSGDSLLAPLGYYGGLTQTMPPLPGSPAIEAGSNASLPVDTFDLDGDSDTTEPLPLDQRGAPRIAGTNVDIGAVEAFALSTAANPVDTDSDGIDDRIETGIFDDLATADASSDQDGDGSPDKEEIANMTNPLDGTDSFHILSFKPEAGFDSESPSFDLILKTFPGLGYRLKSTPDLSLPFADVPGSDFSATGFTETLKIDAAGAKGFFRAVRD